MSYNPPGGFTRKTYTVTNADLLNTIVIAEFSCKIFSAILDADALYDGAVEIEAKQIDSTFVEVDEMHTSSRTHLSNNTGATIGGNWSGTSTNNLIIPLVLRVRVFSKATVGTCKVIIDFL